MHSSEQADSDKGLFVGEPIIGRVTKQATFLVSRRLEYPEQVVPRHRLGHRGVELFQQLLGQFAAAQAKSHHADARQRRHGSWRNIRRRSDGISFVASDKNAVPESRRDGASGRHVFVRMPSGDPRRAAYHQIGRIAALYRDQRSARIPTGTPGSDRPASTVCSR